MLKTRRNNSNRLQGYDYHQPGAYFVTFNTQNGVAWHQNEWNGDLGILNNSGMKLNDFGYLVLKTWQNLPSHYSCLKLDLIAILPNHVHCLLWITIQQRQEFDLSEIIRGFKTFSTREINLVRDSVGAKFWQRGFYDVIVRDQSHLTRIRRYIKQNTARHYHKLNSDL